MLPIRFENARIWTADPACPEADTMVVEGERIAWVGSAADLPAAYAGQACRAVDLQGRRVIPGFVDAHTHVVMLADFAQKISALPPAVHSIEELVSAVAERRAQDGPDGWIQGWGYDEALLQERRSPTRWDLDRGCADAPVSILRTCGHIRCVNSRALELAGITRDTPDPEGGQIERDENGEPTGVLKETARDLINPYIPVTDEDQSVQNLVDLGALLASQGIVAATDMCTLDDVDALPLLRRAARAGMPQDIASYMLWDYVRDDPGYAISADAADRSQQAFLAGIKVLSDGSVSGKTAWFYDPFLDTDPNVPDACGFPTCTDENLEAAIAFCRRTGCQISVHAMGTRAIDRAAQMLAAEPWEGTGEAPFARIEHVTAPSESAVDTFVKTGIGVVTQPIFPYAEIGTYRTNLGDARTSATYPLRTMVDAGARLCISTDAPATSWATPSDPFPNIKSAVTRTAYDGYCFGASEAISIEEALALYTREGARMVGFEGLGMLRPGYKASFTVLDRDLLSVDPEQIDQVKVEQTYIRGKLVFDRAEA